MVYNSNRVSYEELLKAFFERHDPTHGMRQGNDVGTQYRSGIYFTSEAQRRAAEAAKRSYDQALREKGFDAITTEILPASAFYFAEDYHQQYLTKISPRTRSAISDWVAPECPARSAPGLAPRFRSGKIDGVALEVAELHDLKRRFVCRGENDPRCAPSLKGLAPARGTQAPAVSRLKARKAEFGARGGKIVAPSLGEGEKRPSNLDAHRMQAEVFGPGVATA